MSLLPISPVQAIGMLLRRVSIPRVLRALRIVRREDLPVDLYRLEAHVLAGGDVERVVSAAARYRGQIFPDHFDKLCEADLGGDDLDEFVANGMITRAEAKRAALRHRAESEETAAAELCAELLAEVAHAEGVFDNPAISRLSTEVRAGLAEKIRKLVDERRREIQALQERWPALSGTRGPAA